MEDSISYHPTSNCIHPHHVLPIVKQGEPLVINYQPYIASEYCLTETSPLWGDIVPPSSEKCTSSWSILSIMCHSGYFLYKFVECQFERDLLRAQKFRPANFSGHASFSLAKFITPHQPDEKESESHW